MRGVTWLVMVGLGACAGPAADDTADSSPGACGEVSTWDVTVLGRVEDGMGAPVPGARVVLEDRGWEPGTVLGEDDTDGAGQFEFVAEGVTSVEGCWGSLLDYVVVATEGSRQAERGVNQLLHQAIDDGTLEADLSPAPLVLE